MIDDEMTMGMLRISLMTLTRRGNWILLVEDGQRNEEVDSDDNIETDGFIEL